MLLQGQTAQPPDGAANFGLAETQQLRRLFHLPPHGVRLGRLGRREQIAGRIHAQGGAGQGLFEGVVQVAGQTVALGGHGGIFTEFAAARAELGVQLVGAGFHPLGQRVPRRDKFALGGKKAFVFAGEQAGKKQHGDQGRSGASESHGKSQRCPPRRRLHHPHVGQAAQINQEIAGLQVALLLLIRTDRTFRDSSHRDDRPGGRRESVAGNASPELGGEKQIVVLQQEPRGTHIRLRGNEASGDLHKSSFVEKSIACRCHDHRLKGAAVTQNLELPIFQSRAERAGHRKPQHFHHGVQGGRFDLAHRAHPHPVLLVLNLEGLVVLRMGDRPPRADAVPGRGIDWMPEQTFERSKRQRRHSPWWLDDFDEFRVGHPHLRGENLPGFVDRDGVDPPDPYHAVHQSGEPVQLVARSEDENARAISIQMHDGVIAAHARPGVHRANNAGKFDITAVVGTAEQLASADPCRLGQPGFPDHLKRLHNKVGGELAFLEVASDFDFLAEFQIARPIHVHRHPYRRRTVLQGDLGLAVADVVDDPAGSGLDAQTLFVRELPQLADAQKRSLLRGGQRNEFTRRDQEKQRSSAKRNQTEF